MDNQNNSFCQKRKLRELDRLKRKNRRMDIILLIGILQATSLVLCYHLGRSHHKNKKAK